MDNQTNAKVIDELLSKNVFDCVRCNNLLESPVMLVEGEGNICYSCYTDFPGSETKTVLENDFVDSILEKIEIPCTYKPQGCAEKLKHKDFRKHKEECNFRTFNCTFLPTCLWTGCLQELVAHFEKDHASSVLISKNDCYEIFLDNIRNVKNCVYLLKNSCGHFIFCMKRLEYYFMILIYDYTQGVEDINYKFKITFTAELEDDRDISYNIQSNRPVKDWKSFTKLYNNLATITDLDSISNIFRDKELKMTIKLVTDDDCDILKDQFLEQIKCVKCDSYIKSTVYFCSRKHSMCFPCKQCRLDVCEKCQRTVSQSMTVSEKLANDAQLTRLPCKFTQNGCMRKIPLKSDHEFFCEYRKWSCFKSGCNHNLSHAELILHAKHDHKVIGGFEDIANLEMTFFDKENVYHVIEDDLIFEIVHRQHNVKKKIIIFEADEIEYIWNVTIIRGYKKQPYIFEVEISSGTTTPLIVLRNSCHYLSSKDYTESPLELHNHVLEKIFTTSIESWYYKIRVFKGR